jgi:hypothetical protein
MLMVLGNGRVSTFLALALDIYTQKKTTRKGVYVLPEDDKDAQRLMDLKSSRVRSEGYEAPREQSAADLSLSERRVLFQDGGDGDIGYHNRYGAPEETHGPLEPSREGVRGVNMGYHNRFFRD